MSRDGGAKALVLTTQNSTDAATWVDEFNKAKKVFEIKFFGNNQSGDDSYLSYHNDSSYSANHVPLRDNSPPDSAQVQSDQIDGTVEPGTGNDTGSAPDVPEVPKRTKGESQKSDRPASLGFFSRFGLKRNSESQPRRKTIDLAGNTNITFWIIFHSFNT